MSEKQQRRELAERRTRLLGKAYRLFYERPVHIVRGEGVWLFDADGQRYLDCYNNVPHVGHCHPHVVAALSEQAATLNTHTRYLHETVVDYAERLTGLFPAELDVCMFVCTGSEANELALRIARACTGGSGVLVTPHAYHGNTGALAELSRSDPAHENPGPYVRTITAPDSYRGEYRGTGPGAAAGYLADVDAALASLTAQGIQPAALLIDTVYSSEGILDVPQGYLAQAADKVRAAGGLFIADEVQAGFGRGGQNFWGFERHEARPDIVTVGKPMGNGHPLAAVITRTDLADRFAAESSYFNTFGGSPVSCAVGMAVLDVLEHDQLPQNAQETGAYLRTGLNELQQRYACIGDVRGSGLFVGVDLVRDRETREAAPDIAAAVVNGLRERRVLANSTGPHDNVLKLRPPLVFGRAEADLLLERLDATLSALTPAET